MNFHGKNGGFQHLSYKHIRGASKSISKRGDQNPPHSIVYPRDDATLFSAAAKELCKSRSTSTFNGHGIIMPLAL